MIQAMPNLLSRPRRLLFLALAAGLALRLGFIRYYAEIEGDPLIYGDIAKNWFFHGIYGLSKAGSIAPTIIRLPGYPLFLGLCFRLFGIEHYHAVLYAQAVADLLTCLLVGAIAGRMCGSRAGWWALWLAVLCPFTANYTAIAVTETLELLATAAAFYAFLRLLREPRLRWTLLLACSACYAALLRPDGALVGITLYPALLLYGRRPLGLGRSLRFAGLCVLLTAIPFTAWTIRNWRTFHVFQPLAPRYATEPYESTDPGFNRWVSTVCADFACTSDVYWNENSGPILESTLPSRAFDSPAQRRETSQLLDDYNRVTTLTPAIDARFGQLAAERIHDHPWRARLELPLLRLADMWLRPRVEELPIELRWWQYREHPAETEFSFAYAGLNLLLLLAALIGLYKRPPLTGAILVFLLLRCALLLTLETAEPRYTLECFPLMLVLAAVACSRCPTSPRAAFPVQPSE
jgi:Dolichyl-phosphate-mannose-protein mannosyltransferase